MRIGIITFHAANNYGAVIQSYALQEYIRTVEQECEIIDFNSKSQQDFNSLYPKRNGFKSIVKNIFMVQYDSKRRLRIKRFDEFRENCLILSDTCYGKKELKELNKRFDLFIAGSDQIWNTTKKADVNNAYFLSFVDDKKIKVAYAVSLGNATVEDLLPYKKYIMSFSNISCREKSASDIIESIIDKKVATTLDPTLLVKNDIWNNLVKNIKVPYSDYILYYSLDGFDMRKRNIDILKVLSKRLNKKVIALTPEWPKKDFVNVIDAGPIEFLALIKNADLICTNSFHGTALSISMEKDFYVLEKYDGIDDRKHGILEQLGLLDRMISEDVAINKMEINSIDYKKVNGLLDKKRKDSTKYLSLALG